METPWHPDNPEWMSEREREWKKIGRPVLDGLIESEEIEFSHFTAEQLKDYFFTGCIPNDVHIPFYFKIMFYPKPNEFDFVRECVAAADDKELITFNQRLHYLRFYKNNEAFAEVYFSKEIDDRLSGLEQKSIRDKDFIYNAPFSAIITNHADPDDTYFYVHKLDYYLPLVIEYVTNRDDRLFSGVAYLMHRVVHFLEPVGLPGDDTISKQYADIFYQKFENELPKDHMLNLVWQEIKRCRFALKPQFPGGKDQWGADELEELEEELCQECEYEPAIVSKMSSPSSKYMALLKKLIDYFKEYEICDISEGFDEWKTIDVSGLLSSGAKQYFSLPDKPVPAYHYQLSINNCALKSVDDIEKSELATINLFVVPADLDSIGGFNKASILLVPQNGLFQFKYRFQDEVNRIYKQMLRWCELQYGVAFESFFKDLFGEVNISQEEREKEYRNSRALYKEFDLCCEGINYLENPLKGIETYDNGSLPEFCINPDEMKD